MTIIVQFVSTLYLCCCGEQVFQDVGSNPREGQYTAQAPDCCQFSNLIFIARLIPEYSGGRQIKKWKFCREPPASSEWFGQNYESELIVLRYNSTQIVNCTNNSFENISNTHREVRDLRFLKASGAMEAISLLLRSLKITKL